VRIDMDERGQMAFIKEAEGALVPVLLEKYGQETGAMAAKASGRGASKGRDFGPAPLLERK
jgi:hypothetical protein